MTPYTVYCLLILSLCNLLLQIDRFILAIVAKPVAQALQFGDKICMVNNTLYHENQEAFYNGNSDAFYTSLPHNRQTNRSREYFERQCGSKNVRPNHFW